MRQNYLFLIALLGIASCIKAETHVFGSVYYTPEEGFRFVQSELNTTHSIAYGSWRDRVNEDGWGILDIKAGYGIDRFYLEDFERNQIIMQGAGYLEAHLTKE